MTIPTLNETSLAKDCLRRLGEESGILHSAAHVLELVAHNSVGLGEVIQDFAHQSYDQLREITRAAHNVAAGMWHEDDIETLKNAHFIIKTTKTVLQMTPSAMQRNKAETLGEKEKLSRTAIAQVADAFAHCKDIEQLLASENSGNLLAALATGSNIESTMIAPEHTDVFLHTEARH